jgi:sRNA-binding carbon storage regulator CsrA
MLVITRRKFQRTRLKLGNEIIWVQVAAMERDQVRLAFLANPEVKIIREELLDPAERFEAVEANAERRAAQREHQAGAHGAKERTPPPPG